MQTCLKNPLASPSTLGVSAAATFGANFSIIVLGAGALMNTASDAVSISNPYLVTGSAFVCSLGAVLLILALSKLRSFSPESIVLAGTALSSLFSAGTTMIQYFGDDVRIAAAVFWTFGDLAGSLGGKTVDGRCGGRCDRLLPLYALELQRHG